MHQGHKTRVTRLEEVRRPRQRKIFVVYEDEDTTAYEAYRATHGVGAACLVHVVYEGPPATDPLV